MKKIPEGRRFKKGQSGNPAGRRPVPEDVREGRKLTQESLHRALNHLLHCSREEIKTILSNPASDMLTLTVASIISKAALNGDQQRLNFLFDRLLGKVKESMKLSTDEEGFKLVVEDQTFGDLTEEEKAKILQVALAAKLKRVSNEGQP